MVTFKSTGLSARRILNFYRYRLIKRMNKAMLVKGSGGAVGLTEDSVAFRRWLQAQKWQGFFKNLNTIFF